VLIVIPAKAGIHFDLALKINVFANRKSQMDSRFRGNDRVALGYTSIGG
jgi:hypothetical protein